MTHVLSASHCSSLCPFGLNLSFRRHYVVQFVLFEARIVGTISQQIAPQILSVVH